MQNNSIVCEDVDSLASRLAQTIADKIILITQENPLCSLLLAGGTTPKKLYSKLALLNLPWKKVHFFWSDERFVPPNSNDSNYAMVQNFLLSKIEIPENNIHSIKTDFKTKEFAAQNYENVLQDFFSNTMPHFDIAILGIGEDGHVASLFPGSSALNEQFRFVLGVDRQKPPPEGITVTFPILNSSQCTYVLATGENKADAIKRILNSSESIDDCPAKGLKPQNGSIEWWIDKKAAELLFESG